VVQLEVRTVPVEFSVGRRRLCQIVISVVTSCIKVKVKLSLYRPWWPLGLREVEARTFLGIRLVDGGKVVSPTRRPLFMHKKIPDTNFC
jgi:hypothetical protein